MYDVQHYPSQSQRLVSWPQWPTFPFPFFLADPPSPDTLRPHSCMHFVLYIHEMRKWISQRINAIEWLTRNVNFWWDLKAVGIFDFSQCELCVLKINILCKVEFVASRDPGQCNFWSTMFILILLFDKAFSSYLFYLWH